MDIVTIALEGEKGFLEEIRKTAIFQLHKHTNDDLQASKSGLIQGTSRP